MDSPGLLPGESSCDESTGPATPNSSPLLYPLVVDGFTDTSISLLGGIKAKLIGSAKPYLISSIVKSRPESIYPGPVGNVCFIGAGYVGGPTAAVLALHNPDVKITILDKDDTRIGKWNSNHLPIAEPGLDNVVRITRDGAQIIGKSEENPAYLSNETTRTEKSKRIPNLTFTSNSEKSISEADMIFLAVSTPTKTLGLGAGRATDMTAVHNATRDIAAYARSDTIIVEKSTVPCGTAKQIRQMLSEQRPGESFEVLSNPEFLSEGSAIENLLNPDRIIIGSSNTISGRQAARLLAELYTSWIPSSRIVHTNAYSSELSKLVVNSMLAQRISSINSISAICDATGANIDEVAKSVGLDPRVGPQFLKAGLGFGGSCFRKDIASLTYLAQSLGLDDIADYWDQVNRINEMQRLRFVKNVIRRLDNTLISKKITLLGFAFKKNTGDTRESLAVDVIRILLEERPEEIAVYDPFCRKEDVQRELQQLYAGDTNDKMSQQHWPVKIYTDPYEACSQSNAILIVTDHDQFKHRPREYKGDTTALISNTRQLPSTAKPINQTTEADIISLPTTGHIYKMNPQPYCPDTKSQSTRQQSSTQIQWSRIAIQMKNPKWLFDGRGIIDIPSMTELGFRVDTIGRGRYGDD